MRSVRARRFLTCGEAATAPIGRGLSALAETVEGHNGTYLQWGSAADVRAVEQTFGC